MKRKMFFIGTLALMVAGGIFWSCQKDSDLVNPGEELMLKGAVKPTPTLEISYLPAPGMVGEDVVVSALVSYLDVNLTCGQVQLFRALDANGNPCSVANMVTWDNVWGAPKDAPGGTYTTTYSAAGLYGFRAQYESSGPDCDYANLTGGNAITFDITVVDGCTDPLTITPYLVSGGAEDGKLYTFKTKWVVKACEDFTNLKTQGGLTAGSVVVSTAPTASSIKSTKQNVVINWVQPNVTAGNEFVYEVVFTRTLKNTCTTYDITGAWSAKAWQLKDVDDGLGNLIPTMVETVAGYNNKIYFTIPCP